MKSILGSPWLLRAQGNRLPLPNGYVRPWFCPLQFVYRANRSMDDAVNMGLHFILQHLDRPGTYVRILFVDFNSAFNTIIPNHFLPKLTQLSVPTSVCQWITSFLTNRQQLVRLGIYTSSTISTGAPQGCILSPLLFSLYTSDNQVWLMRSTFLQSLALTLIKHTGAC